MTSFLDRLKGKMTSLSRPLFKPTKRPDKAVHTVITNRWDELTWADAQTTRPVDDLITDLRRGTEYKEEGGRAAFDRAPELVHDLFMSFYKAAPRLEDKANVEHDVYAVRSIIEQMLTNPKLADLHEHTVGEPVMSVIALDAAADSVRDIIGRIPPPPPPPAPKAPKQDRDEDGEQSQESEDGEPGDQPGDNSGEPGDGNGSEAEFDPDAEQQDQAELNWQAEYDEKLAEMDIDRAVIKALDAAQEGADELEDIRKGIGPEDGEWQTMSPEERLALAERLRTPEMRILADIVGRMKRFALGVRANRIVNVPHEAFDVETGDRLKDVLNSEYALLATPETSYEFYRKFAEGQLLQYKLRGTEEVGKGPIVICIDKSYSMDGEPFMWAMGVAEALRRFAAEEDRDYFAMFFGTNNDRIRFDFPKGKGPFEKVLTFLSCVANGGTEFDGVLTEALQKASTAFDGEARGKADIVFLTDGEGRLSDKWIEDFNAERTRVGVRVYSVFIGGAYDMNRVDSPLGLLNRISDVAFPVSELKPSAVKDIFAQI